MENNLIFFSFISPSAVESILVEAEKQYWFGVVQEMAETTEETHPLENTWVISEQYQQEEKVEKAQDYDNSFEKICTFSTIEDFWSYWNRIPAVSYDLA